MHSHPPPSEENGPEGGTAKAGLRRPGIQSRRWPGLGVSAPGSRGHLPSSLTTPLTLLPSPFLAPNSFPPPYLRHPSAGKGSFQAPAARLPDPRRGYLLQKRDKGQGTRGGEAAQRNEGRSPGEEGGRRRRWLSLAFPCSQRSHYCARGRLPGRPPPPAPKTRGCSAKPGSPRAGRSPAAARRHSEAWTGQGRRKKG